MQLYVHIYVRILCIRITDAIWPKIAPCNRPMLYDTASNPLLPSLNICPIANILGWAPLSPCFIDGNTHPTIPYKFKNSESWDRHQPIPSWIAVTAADCMRWISGCGPDDIHRRQTRSSERGKNKGRRDKAPKGGGSQTGSGECSCGRMKTFVPISHMISHMILQADIRMWCHSWYDITWYYLQHMIS